MLHKVSQIFIQVDHPAQNFATGVIDILINVKKCPDDTSTVTALPSLADLYMFDVTPPASRRNRPLRSTRKSE